MQTRDLTLSTFVQSVAEQASDDKALARFYQQTKFAPLWTGETELHQQRRNALVAAVDLAAAHGLPVERYQMQEVIRQLDNVRTEEDRAAAEVMLSKSLVRLSHDLKFGILDPHKVIPAYKRERPDSAEMDYLATFSAQDPNLYFHSLLPGSEQYVRLFAARNRLIKEYKDSDPEHVIRAGWLRPGDSGADVVALRERLVSLDYMQPTDTESYDKGIIAGVRAFQVKNGLSADGVAGPATLAVLNTSTSDQLRAVMVAMERERWFNRDLEPTYVAVNLTDFSVRLVVDDREVFETRTVIGKNEPNLQTPEFSDQMEYMVINPTWNVPRSIVVKEYLPKLQRNHNAVSHLDIYNQRGQKVSRGAVNFRAYNEKNFPFRMKQKPSPRNALGQVKFMFPNRYNIYLHDTPSKSLFNQPVRAYSHGCIRLQKPFDFAYSLLALQSESPEALFQRYLDTGQERTIKLKEPIPVHLMYRTAYVNEHGKLEFRPDIYGRDRLIWEALEQAGVHIQEAGG